MNEQRALIELEDDSALLFSVEERRKRYTAAQAAELERLHTSVLMLLSSWPVDAIARELHLNTRTVRALAAMSAEKVAGFKKEFGEMLLRTGARWVALARTKEHEASFRDLNIGAGIVMDHARELALMGQVGEEPATKEDQDHVAAALALRALMDQARPAETQSTGPDLQDSQLDQAVAADVPQDPGQAARTDQPAPTARAPGGGSGGPAGALMPMPPPEADSQPKGPPDERA